MAFPSSPTPGQTHTEDNTTWVYAGPVNGWYRQSVTPGNSSTFTGGTSGAGGGSATAAGASGEIQFTDGTNLDSSTDLAWDDTGKVLEVGGDINLDDGGSFTTTLQTVTPTANRTISFPNATGTVALVAGSSGQLLYNNAGANAGVSSFTADSSGRLTNSASSASGFPVKLWNGTIFAGTTPHVLVQPSTASAGSWSASGTAFGVNTAAAFGGNLLDLQVNGTSNLSVSSSGTVFARSSTETIINPLSAPNGYTFNGSNGRTYIGVPASPGAGLYFWADNGNKTFFFTTPARTSITSAASFGWMGTDNNLSVDLSLFRDTADTLAQRRGTNAQTFRVYNTFTSSTNYELGKLEWSSNAFRIGTEKGSGGGTARALEFQTDGTTRWTMSASSGSLSATTNAAIYLENGGIGRANYSFISFPTVDGNILLSNWNANGFGRLQFGGTTSSFPSIKRNSAELQARLADDSAYTTIDAQHRLQGTAPASATATGTAGDIRYDADYIYICTATNTWKRASIATW
jgi:hypothetical protein